MQCLLERVGERTHEYDDKYKGHGPHGQQGNRRPYDGFICPRRCETEIEGQDGDLDERGGDGEDDLGDPTDDEELAPVSSRDVDDVKTPAELGSNAGIDC